MKLEKKMEDLEQKVANFKDLEKKVNDFEIVMEEQRKTIKNAKEVITGLVAKIEKHSEKIEKQEIIISKVDEIEKANEKIMKCAECSFTSASEQGMKTHISRKHKEEQFPHTCSFCETILKTKKELTVHMKKHSFKPININAYKFKCN